ncbi:MAG: nuclear transport factor 2 family protein [Deltaproteobacteria bacterium]|nr:nuclear transport factor 2 family protein [Deltaproteobacteria bacterium]
MLPTPEDHAAICDLYARYCLALDRCDADAWVALFTADARFLVYGREWSGHEGLRQLSTAAPSGLHLGGVPQIEMTSASSAHVARNLLFAPSDGSATRSAVYEDEVLRTESGWRIASCRCRFITASGLSERPAR